MATAAEYKSVLDLAKLALEFYGNVQQAATEANAQYESDTARLCRLIKLKRMNKWEALQAHGYREEPAANKFALIAEYEAFGFDRSAAMAQATTHVNLFNAREEAITNGILKNADKEEEERQYQHEEAMMNMKFEHEEKEMTLEEKKMQHELALVDRTIEQERQRHRITGTAATAAVVDQETFYANVKVDKTKLATNVVGFFEMIHAIVSGKLARRSVVGMPGQGSAPRQPMMQFETHQVQQMIVANKFTEDVQFSMLELFNNRLTRGHFHISNGSNEYARENIKRPVHLAMARTSCAAGEQKSPLNIAMLIKQKVAPPTVSDFYQFYRDLSHVLRASGPGRTHVIGAIVYRVPVPDEMVTSPATTTTIPNVSAKLHKITKNPKPGFSKLVVDVYALFQRIMLPYPGLIRLAPGQDASTFFAAVGSSETVYVNLQRSFALQSFTEETFNHTTYKRVRFLGTGANTTEVWECIKHPPAGAPEPNSHSAIGLPTQNLEIPIRPNSFALKRCNGMNFDFVNEARILQKLAQAEVLQADVGKCFPELVNSCFDNERSFLLTKPVCRKVVRGSEIRMAHYFPSNLQSFLDRVGALFADYVDTLEKCHKLGVLHKDISLRNLMAAEIRPDPIRHPHVVEYKGCIIDWECAVEFDVNQGFHEMRDGETKRLSFETATRQYLETGSYAPADDLISLVRCWKWATQPTTYKAVKQWQTLSSNRLEQVKAISRYWQCQHCDLDAWAEQVDYVALRQYFRENPKCFEPKQPKEVEEEQGEAVDFDLGDDEKQLNPSGSPTAQRYDY